MCFLKNNKYHLLNLVQGVKIQTFKKSQKEKTKGERNAPSSLV